MFEHVEPFAGDPILSLNEDFQKDPRPHKINLSIGIYFDDAGKIPVLDSVRRAEAIVVARNAPKPYLPIEGAANFREQVCQGKVVWQRLWDKTNDEGQVLDQFSIADTSGATPEGYRLWWFHSTRKAELDLAVREHRLKRAEQELRNWQQKLRSPRSRHRPPCTSWTAAITGVPVGSGLVVEIDRPR